MFDVDVLKKLNWQEAFESIEEIGDDKVAKMFVKFKNRTYEIAIKEVEE